MNINPRHLLVAVIIIIAVAFAVTSCGATQPISEIPQSHLVTEIYIVQSGDTLWTISSVFMDKNTYGPREIREFYHGIIEANYDDVFEGREPGMVVKGDRLKINYFVK